MPAVARLIGPYAGSAVIGALVGEAADDSYPGQPVGRIGYEIGGDRQKNLNAGDGFAFLAVGHFLGEAAFGLIIVIHVHEMVAEGVFVIHLKIKACVSLANCAQILADNLGDRLDVTQPAVQSFLGGRIRGAVLKHRPRKGLVLQLHQRNGSLGHIIGKWSGQGAFARGRIYCCNNREHGRASLQACIQGLDVRGFVHIDNPVALGGFLGNCRFDFHVGGGHARVHVQQN
ncbi:hypothetical protein D3C75_645200 [compost metagenome]